MFLIRSKKEPITLSCTMSTILIRPKDIKMTGEARSVKSILNDCLQDSGLTYEMKDEVIIIKPAPKATTKIFN